MKLTKWLISLLMLMCLMFAVGCSDDEKDDGKDDNGGKNGGSFTLPANPGELHITGAEAYNGKFVGFTAERDGAPSLNGYAGFNREDFLIKFVKVENGEARIPVVTRSDDWVTTIGYSGNDDVTDRIWIYFHNEETKSTFPTGAVAVYETEWDWLSENPGPLAKVEFTNGKATVDLSKLKNTK